MQKRKPELLSPAGDWPALVTALESGADSVYFGLKDLNMRHLAGNFDVLEIKKIMDFLHSHQKKGYLALNINLKNSELKKVGRFLQEAKSFGVDAVILWDMAVFSMAKKIGIPIHISTQAGVSNLGAVIQYAQMGAQRVILARECSLKEIIQMIGSLKSEGIACEVETFIHGAMCISISGRCLLSAYSFGKSANRGECLQPCRREYLIKDKEGETEYILGEDYLLSAKDLCTIDFLDQLIEAGIHSFKIEGRMRAPEYIKVTTSAYRRAIDSYFEGKLSSSLKRKLKEELSSVFNRGSSDGFYFGRPLDAISRRLEHTHEKTFLGEV